MNNTAESNKKKNIEKGLFSSFGKRISPYLKKLILSVGNETIQNIHIGSIIFLLVLITLHLLSGNGNIQQDFQWLLTIFDFSPDIKFLSDVAAFEAAIIAFLIPLSIEIVSKLSERYQSAVIVQSFQNSFENRNLYKMLLINIGFAIFLRFLPASNSDDLFWKISSWVIFIFFLYITIAVYKVIKRIKTYMSDPQVVIDILFREAENVLDQ